MGMVGCGRGNDVLDSNERGGATLTFRHEPCGVAASRSGMALLVQQMSDIVERVENE